MSTTTEGPPTGKVTLPGDPVACVVVSVRAALASVVETPMWSLTESQLQAGLSDLLAVRAQLEQLTGRVAGLDRGPGVAAGGGVLVDAGVVGVKGAGLGR